MAQVTNVSNAKPINPTQFGDPGTVKGTSPEQAAENPPPEQPAPEETQSVESESGKQIDVTA
jgi:hypothetical protein